MVKRGGDQSGPYGKPLWWSWKQSQLSDHWTLLFRPWLSCECDRKGVLLISGEKPAFSELSASCLGSRQLLPALGSLEKANWLLLGTAEQVAVFTKCLQLGWHHSCHLMPRVLQGFLGGLLAPLTLKYH